MNKNLSGKEARALIRKGGWRAATAALAAGYIQANLVIVPNEYALDFKKFCVLNPKPCPLLEVLPAGVFAPSRAVSQDGDITTDIPLYRIYENGEFVKEVQNIKHIFNSGMTAFLLGCSFSFDAVLIDAGVPVRHIESGKNVSMFITNIPCLPSGIFKGPMVVSMRPIPKELIEKAVCITEKIPFAHGAPVHIGEPEKIGIKDIYSPDFGDAVKIKKGEVPAFWACGVTPQAIAKETKLPFMITHSPGCMFITDKRLDDLIKKN